MKTTLNLHYEKYCGFFGKGLLNNLQRKMQIYSKWGPLAILRWGCIWLFKKYWNEIQLEFWNWMNTVWPRCVNTFRKLPPPVSDHLKKIPNLLSVLGTSRCDNLLATATTFRADGLKFATVSVASGNKPLLHMIRRHKWCQ